MSKDPFAYVKTNVDLLPNYHLKEDPGTDYIDFAKSEEVP